MGSWFTKRESQGVVLFVLLAGAVILGLRLAERREDSLATAAVERLNEAEEPIDSLRLAPFDPNTADYEALRELGMSRYEAVSLLKFRASGKVFRIPEDVALCYGISDSAYRVLAPYIQIGEAYRIKPRAERTYTYTRVKDSLPRLPLAPFRIDTVSAKYLRAIGAFTKRQAEAVIRWRDRSGFRDMEEFRECYVVEDSIATLLEPYILFPEPEPTPWEEPIEINRADSATLRRVVGIGEKTVVEILKYRLRLGGFHHIEQIREVRGVTPENYYKISQQICCDSNEIQKIDINFAPPETLRRHPYIPPGMLRRIIKFRTQKGGWSSTQELVRHKIVTQEEAERLRPYLVFGTEAD
ncbi:MAG: helix-hairpin-helix domain-containing protein [Alistipes sp.]|nr:helix-hairpin-helix domain-containing protein [Alistipes sp.]